MEKAKLFDVVILVLSLYVLSVMALSLVYAPPAEIQQLLDYIDNSICVIFLIDFFYRLIHAPNKWAYLKWGWIDLISSIPTLSYFRYGRIFRVIRLIRIFRAFKSLINISRFIFRSKIKGTMLCANLSVGLLLIFSAITILYVETAPNSNIQTASDAIWWTCATLTTVGYGDLYPVTMEGRMVGILLMLSGIGVTGVYSAWILSFFLNKSDEEEA